MAGFLQIHLLGQYAVRYDEMSLTTLDAERVRSLLAYLLLARGRSVPRQEIAAELWPDATEAQARGNLRNLLHQLRGALPDADHHIETTRQTLAWRESDRACLDVALFEQALDAAQGAIRGEGSTTEALERAVQLYHGELLPDCYDEWLSPYREDLRQRYGTALRLLMEAAEARGAPAEALHWAERLRLHDPLDEAIYIHLMRLHAKGGNRAEVHRLFQQCVAMLEAELGVEPSPETQAAYEEWRAFLPPLTPAPALPLSLPPRPSSAVPVPATPLVGRAETLTQLATMLQEPLCRLLTLVGPGGIGKTRLALAVAAQAEATQAVAFIPLAPLASPEHIVRAIAEGLEVVAEGQHSLFERVVGRLQGQPWLLVLDNAEHLIDGMGVVADLLAQAEKVKVLLTSRERVRLRDEWLFDVAGLGVPLTLAPGESAMYGAVQLFLQGAQRVERTFALTPHNQAAIVRICQLVEGLPLALELAASWVRLLSCDEIAQEIAASLDFLASTDRDVPARHQSLRAVFEHSWTLLSVEEQRALARLSVFRGPFTRQAAVAVARTSLPCLTALVDKSLVRQVGGGRYDLHPLVRQYAAPHLQALPEDERATQQRFVTHYAERLAAWEAPLRQSRDRQTMTEMHGETDHLHQTLAWALALGDARALCRGSAALALFYETAGWFAEGEQLFGEAARTLAIHAAVGQGPASAELRHQQEARCHLLAHQANFEQLRGKLAELRRTLEALRELATHLGLASWHNEALRIWGTALRYLGSDPAEAQAVLDQAVARYEAAGDPLGAIRTLNILADLHIQNAQLDAALDCLQRALRLNATLNNTYLQALTTSELGVASLFLNRYPLAREYFQEALRLFEAMDDALGIARTSNNLGMLLCWLGHPEEAVPLLQQSLVYVRRCQSLIDETATLDSLAATFFALGDYTGAGQCWEEALLLSTRSGWQQGLGWAQRGLGQLALARGDDARASEYLEQALRATEAAHAPRERALCLGDLAALAHRLGHHTLALARYQEAVSRLLELDVPHEAAALLIQQATLLAELGQAALARDCAQQGVGLAERAARPAIVWKGQLLLASLEALHGERATGTALLTALLPQAPDDAARAEALYLLWQTEGDERWRRAALDGYAALAARIPAALPRERANQLAEGRR